VIRSYVLRAGRRPGSAAVTREARAFFGVGPSLAVEEIAAVADRFPVFRVVPDHDDQQPPDGHVGEATRSFTGGSGESGPRGVHRVSSPATRS